MKVEAPSSSKVSKQAVMVVSAIPGAAVSRGVAGFVPGGVIGKVALAGLALFGAASVKGTDTKSGIGRGFLAGMAIQQAGEAFLEAVQPAANSYVSSGEPSKFKTFVARTVGLASPDSYYQAPMLHEYEDEQEQGQLGNPYPKPRSAQLGVG